MVSVLGECVWWVCVTDKCVWWVSMVSVCERRERGGGLGGRSWWVLKNEKIKKKHYFAVSRNSSEHLFSYFCMFFSFAKRSKLGETVTCFVQFCISRNCQPYYPYIHLPRVSWYSLNYLPPESGYPQSLAARKWVSLQSLAAREWVSVQSLAARVWVTVQSFAARELRIRTITCRQRFGYPYTIPDRQRVGMCTITCRQRVGIRTITCRQSATEVIYIGICTVGVFCCYFRGQEGRNRQETRGKPHTISSSRFHSTLSSTVMYIIVWWLLK